MGFLPWTSTDFPHKLLDFMFRADQAVRPAQATVLAYIEDVRNQFPVVRRIRKCDTYLSPR
jgi:hypothetical protein